MKWLSKCLNLVLSQMWLLVVGAFGVLALAVKLMGRRVSGLKTKNKTLEEEVQRAERIQDVKTTTTRDDAIERLRRNGDLRQD